MAAGESRLAPTLTRRLIEEHVRQPALVQGVPGAIAGADRAGAGGVRADCSRAVP